MSFSWDYLPDMNAIEREFRQRMEKTAGAAGDAIVRVIRDEIPPPRGAGSFPGWRAQGGLEGSVTRTPTQETAGGGFETTIYIRSGARGASGYPVDVYKKTQEYGRVIRAKKPGGFMVFQVEDGTWVRAKRVYIRPKSFFWKGFEYVTSRMNEIASAAMRG